MRRVASSATLHFHGRMFEDERAAFLGMTVDADLPGRLPQHGLTVCTVCIMTIGALQESFGNAVMGWQSELRLNGGMARITKPRLRLTQQAFCQPAILFADTRRPEKLSLRQWSLGFVPYPNGFGQMCRMAGLTGHAVQFVFGSVEQRLIVTCHMTVQA